MPMQLQFEMERRVVLFHRNTTMPDNSLLGYEGNPNEVINGNTSGETLIYNSPRATFYQELNDGTLWYKTKLPNIWEQVGSNSEGNDYIWNELLEKYINKNTHLIHNMLPKANGQFLSLSGVQFSTNYFSFPKDGCILNIHCNYESGETRKVFLYKNDEEIFNFEINEEINSAIGFNKNDKVKFLIEHKSTHLKSPVITFEIGYFK